MASAGQCMSPECSSSATQAAGAADWLRPGPVLVGLLLVLVTWLAASWWRRYAHFRRLELAMPGPRSLPVLGSVLELIGINDDNALEKMMGLWGGHTTELSRVAVFNHLFVFVTDPDHIAKVLRDRRFAEKSSYGYSDLSEVLGQGLITADSATWKRHLTILQPAFHLEVLDTYVEIFAEEAANLVERLRPMVGKDFECFDEMQRTTGDNIVATVTPASADDQVRNRIQGILPMMAVALASKSTRMFRPWLWPSVIYNLTESGRKQAAINQTFNDVFDDMVKGVRLKRTEEDRSLDRERKFGFKARKSFVDVFSGSSFSSQELIDEFKTIGGASIETSAKTLSLVLKVLSIRPDIQTRVFEELCEVFHGSDGPVSSADLPRLEYTERVIKETMRIFPILPFVGRTVSQDTELGSKVIPPKTTILINIFGLHRDPRFFPDPLTFDPDRFLPERTAEWHPYCYLPFSGGSRNCIGKDYAMMQIKTILATLLRVYSVQPADDGITHPSQIPLTYGVTLAVVGSLKVRLEQIGSTTLTSTRLRH